MNIDAIFLLIIYALSTVSILISIYALWTVSEIQEELRKERVAKRLKSVTSQVRKPSATWPPR